MHSNRRQFVKSAIISVSWVALGAQAMALSNDGGSNVKKGTPMSKKTGWKTVKVSDNTEMKVFVAYPPNSDDSVPGVLVLQEAFGVNAHIRDVTQRIANLGYVAAAPELYHRTAPGFQGDYENMAPSMEQMQKMTDDNLEADLRATYDLLANDNQVDKSRIGSVGYCLGGFASYVANSILPLKAAVSYYGSKIAKELPRAKAQNAPLLMFWGGKDTHTGREQYSAICAALSQADKNYVEVIISDGEHGFFCDVRKSYNPVAARESWALFTSFFKEYLNA